MKILDVSSPIELSEDEQDILSRMTKFFAKSGMQLERKVTAAKGGPWLIYTRGDNTFQKGNLYARFELRRLPNSVSPRNLWLVQANVHKKVKGSIDTLYSLTKKYSREAVGGKLRRVSKEFVSHL